jgi:hypothetical protein
LHAASTADNRLGASFIAHRSRSVGVTVLDATVVIAITPAVPAMIWPGTVAAVASPVRITLPCAACLQPDRLKARYVC